MGIAITVVFGLGVLALLITQLASLRSRLRTSSEQERRADPAETRTQALRWVVLGIVLVGGAVSAYLLLH